VSKGNPILFREKRRLASRLWRIKNLDRERARCREDRRRRYAADPEKYRVAMRRWNAANPDAVYFCKVKQLYGINKREFDQLLSKQNNCCAICHEPLKRGRNCNVDHCHDTNEVCGILCRPCNLALGMIKNSSGIAVSMAEYLNRTRRGQYV
jgi:hypothetical protein